MKALRTKTPAALDNPTRWHNYLRPWFDVERYQQQINDRVGLNRDGRPIVRLVWGQDATSRAFYEETPRYWTRRQKAHPSYQWWTVPRWIFERRLEPEQYVDAWNAKRYSIRDPSQGNIRCGDCNSSEEPKLIDGKLYCRTCMSTNFAGGAVIDKGPPPDDYYIFMLECAVHEAATDAVNGWPRCCARAFYTDRMRCWGQYRHPNDFDLLVLSQSTREMEKSGADPYRPLTLAELEETELASMMQVEQADEMFRQYERQMMLDFNRLHGHHITGSTPVMVDYGARDERIIKVE